jgi:glycosyltransferase involved in cell wall biosynthesis
VTKDNLLSIIVPCYNEAENIPLIIKRFREVLERRTDIEVLLVNNGSKDKSAKVFESELDKVNDQRFRLINVQENKGYGFGIKTGLEAAKGNVLAWTHADMQTDPKDVVLAFDLYLANNNPMVFLKGKRRNRAFTEQFFTWGMQMLSSLALGVNLEDVNAQPKLFSRIFYEKYLLLNAPDDFSLDLYALFWAKKSAKILSIPVYFNQRKFGEAKGGGSFHTRIKLVKRTWAYIFELKRSLKAV